MLDCRETGPRPPPDPRKYLDVLQFAEQLGLVVAVVIVVVATAAVAVAVAAAAAAAVIRVVCDGGSKVSKHAGWAVTKQARRANRRRGRRGRRA